MRTPPGTVQLLLDGMRTILNALVNRLRDEEAPAFFADLGVTLTPAQATSLAAPLNTFRGSVADFVGQVSVVDKALEAGDAPGIAQGQVAALARLAQVFGGLPSVASAVGGLPGVPPGVVAALPGRLVNHMITEYFGRSLALNELLEFMGILQRDDVNAGSGGPFHTVDTFHLDEVGKWLGRPGDRLAQRYDWGTPGFDGTKLLRALGTLVAMLGLPALVDESGLDLVNLRIVPRTDLEPRGVSLHLDASTVPAVVEHTGPDWKFGVAVDFGLPQGTEIVLQSNGAVTIRPPDATSVAGAVRISYEITRPPETPMVILGSPGGSRLETTGIAFFIELGVRWDGAHAQGVVAAGGGIPHGKVVLDLTAADGFLARILPAPKIENDFDVEFGYSSAEGLHFHGSGALEIKLPVHIKLGAVEVTALALSAGVRGAEFPISLSGDLKAALGPLTAVVEDIGLGAVLALSDGDHGNLGPVDVGFAFKPPKGAGLAIDAGVVTGGGYLRFDPDRGEYAGALELKLAGFIAVKAIGLITTRMPDGARGFSLVIIMTAEFGGGGIQLGFGFTLLGVGGILGLNRRMDLDALVEGVVSGSLESVLFPEDVIANAPRIIGDLRKFFPPEDGRFLIGPMVKIGWGTPTLVSVSLGVIVEIPPGDIAILGMLQCVLPSADVPLLVLQVQFVGAFEPDKSRLWFFAKLFDSRVLTMTIDGGMGLLISMGDNPDFVLTVGGFHPSFKPPALPFPVPPRLSIDILNAPGRLLRVSGYFAVTSNTVQFGAKAELRLGFSDFGIEGHLAFDALFQFSPFRFVIAISAGLSLKAFGVGLFGIDLQFQLEGPAPWRAHGRGSISLLFFEISADFDISWGEERNTTLPAVEVLALLEREIRKPEGWRTRPPAGGGDPLVTLRQLPEGDLVLHPLGTLFIHQRAIPLDVRIDRIGAQRPSDGKRFSVAPAAGSGLERVSVTGDQFAMAQFQDMDDAAKLSRPAYENQDAGIELAPEQGAIASPRVVRRSARYELHIIDNDPPNPGAVARPAMALARPLAASRIGAPAGPSNGVRSLANGADTPRPPRLYSPHPAVFGRLLAGSSTARSPLSQRAARLRQPFTQDATVRVAGDRFIVAYLRNNRQAFPPVTASATTSSFRSEATALDALDDWVHADASLSGRLHVLRQAETGGGAAVRPGTWSATSPPPAAVAGADAVLLTGGTVLVAGGSDAAGDPVAGTAVYDPVAATWADASPPLATARRRHTATKLGNGRVVVAGGLGTVGAPLASAEVFDPVAVTWTTPQRELHTARSGHSATAVGGGLLVAGGTGARGAALASAELLDPDTLTWTEVAALNCARTGHRAVLIDHGKVLVIGGALPTGEGERALAFCEIYDPATKTWTPTGSLLTPRKGHQATVLADGRVLVTGGDAVPAVPAVPYRPESLATAELYDPQAGTWTRAADLPGGGRTGHRSVRTPAGVLLVGGVGRPRATAGFRKALMFDPGANAWTSTDSLGTGRWDFPAVDLSDGRVLAVGGLALAGPAAPGPAPAELAVTAEVYLP